MTGNNVVPASDVAKRSRAFDALAQVHDGLYWVESDADSDSSAVAIWSQRTGTITEIPAQVGSSLHAYGGGAVAMSEEGVWYVNANDGQLWQPGAPSPLTHEHRTLGDLTVVGRELLCVGENPGNDELLTIDIVTGRSRSLHAAPFLAAPRLYGEQLAWIQWAADVMPWDSSELWLADCRPGGSLTNLRKIAGGPGISVTEPKWSPDGHLHYLSDEDGWWNVYRRTLAGEVSAIAPMKADCAAAPWEHGYSSYVFLPERKIAMITQNGPRHSLVIAEGQGATRSIPTPYTSLKPYLAAAGSHVALIGSAPTRSQQVALVDTNEPLEPFVIRYAASNPDAAAVSTPQHLTVVSAGADITVLYYPAAGHEPKATIVRAHPGPTHQSDLRLDWEVQYFTSRGYAIADVDYRGSTGYGRTFRTALNGRWGVADVQDCTAAANHLVEIGLARKGSLVIFGASAGGFTALRSVCDMRTPFALAVARSAIVNPVTWQQTAPRFQRPHAAVLANKGAMIDADKICRPVALVHGIKDAVAPIADVRHLVDALHDVGSVAKFLELPGVGHSLSGKGLVDALGFELAAYSTVSHW